MAARTIHADNADWEAIRRRAAEAGYRNVSKFVMACSAAADPAKVVAEHRRLTSDEEAELREQAREIAELRREILKPPPRADWLDTGGRLRCPDNLRDAIHASYLLLRWQREH